MKVSGPALVLLLFACALANTAAAQGGRPKGCAVRGRAVDDRGAPVPKAAVLVDGGQPAGWEDLIIVDNADEQGYFSYQLERCPFPAESMTLYVTSPVSFDHYAPFTAPFLRSGRAGRAYAGQAVRGKRKGDLELGEVRVQAFFTAVTLKFVGRDGRPLLTADDWAGLYVRLKTAGGLNVSETTLSASHIEKAVRSDESSLVMELPEGSWQVELLIYRKGKHRLKADRLVEVPRGSVPFTLTLQMDRQNNPKGR